MMLGATRTLCKRKEPRWTGSPTEVTGRAEPSPTMMEEGQEGEGGWVEVRMLAYGVVSKEALESAIQSAKEAGGRLEPPRARRAG